MLKKIGTKPVCSCMVLLLFPALLIGAENPTAPNIMISTKVQNTPNIDGVSYDKAWVHGKTRIIRLKKTGKEGGSEIDMALTCVHNQTHLFFLAQWLDETRDDSHKPWVWNKNKKSYEKGKQQEDVLSFAFPLEGEFTGNMLSPIESKWDVWYWKAARTNPAGYAMDKYHVYSFQKPKKKAKSFKTRSGKLIWIARPEDSGLSVTTKRNAPDTLTTTHAPHYIPRKPTGSAADVLAKGVWKNGLWSVELARKLNTGNADDAVLKTGSSIKMAIAIFDHSEHVDHSVSEVLTLQLQE